MILDDADQMSDRTTLDELFRRAGVRHSEMTALADPLHREAFTGGAPRTLSFAEADRAISAVAAKLRQLGLPTDAVIGLQLPNTVESVIALLAVLRAGMIAAPLPLLWRQQEIVEALGRVGAKAIVTAGRIGSCNHAELAMQAAVELFPIRHVCAFGGNLPDGVVPLDDCFAPAASDMPEPYFRIGNPAAHLAVITFEVGADGIVPLARNHAQLIAGGLGPFLESGMPEDAAMLSVIPPASFAGIALTVLPWLLSGGTLHLHHGFDADAFAAQRHALAGGMIVLPATVLAPLAGAGRLEGATSIVALWRAPERLASSEPWYGEAALVDVASFGEVGLIATRRDDGMPAAITLGTITAPRGAGEAIAVIETARSKAGSLVLRGPMVPARAFPPGAERGYAPYLAPDVLGFIDTDFACSVDRARAALVIGAPPAGRSVIGAYRFRQAQVDAQIASLDPAATIVALPDALLGERLAGSATDREAMLAGLQANGTNPLITGAFRPRGKADAA